MRKPALLTQILAVNSVLILATVLAAGAATTLDPESVADRRHLAVLLAAVLTTVLVNGLVLRRRLAPLASVIATMEEVDLARPGVRVDPRTADSEEVERLHHAFNRMLSRLEAERAAGARAVLRAQEAERARLARDLHDEVNQSLTALLLRLGAIEQGAPEDLRVQLRETRAVASRAGEELLRLARELRPVALDDLGLEAALRTQLERFGRDTGLRARLDVQAPLQGLGEDEQIVVYRVVQESLSNVAQHAAATQVRVVLRERDGRPAVSVIDDGRGIAPPEDPEHAGDGLVGMRERALLAGGRLNVRSAAGVGTTVELVLGAAA